MQITISTEFIAWLVIWFPLWALVSYITTKKNINVNIEKLINITLVLTWLWMHIAWFINWKDVEFMFNVIWGWSVWHLVWFDTLEIINKLKKWKQWKT